MDAVAGVDWRNLNDKDRRQKWSECVPTPPGELSTAKVEQMKLEESQPTPLNVIIPLGGLGTRFHVEGYYSRPKPFVNVLGKALIVWVVEHLKLIPEDTLIIAYSPKYMSTGNFMKEVLGNKFPNCRFVEVDGQARTVVDAVALALQSLEEPLLKRPTVLAEGDTFYILDILAEYRRVWKSQHSIYCFEDPSVKPLHSYVKTDENCVVLDIKEKFKISSWACSGCYCFRDGSKLLVECTKLLQADRKDAGPCAIVAQMLQKREQFIACKLEKEDFHFLATPAQLEEFCRSCPVQPAQRFVFDLEGVLIVGIKGGPIQRNIALAQRLKKQGHTIIIHSSRAYGDEAKTWALLEKLQVPCDDLRLGKPRGDIYIGGPNVVDGVLGDLDKQIGFYPTEVMAETVKKVVSPKPKKAKMQVIDLQPDSKGVTCLVKPLGEVTEIESVTGGKFYELLVGDPTGKIVFSLTEAQKDALKHNNMKTFIARNASVKMVGGHMRLVVYKWGKVEVNTKETVDSIGKVNVSDVEYEFVAD